MRVTWQRLGSVLVTVGVLAVNGAGRATKAEGSVRPQHAPGEAVSQQDGEIDPRYGCLICHADKRRAYLLGVHSDRGVRCHDCHGGNPEAFEIPEAHGGDFRGSLGKLATVEVCSGCHSDPNLMRQYGMHVDQVAELQSSRHGQMLLERGSDDAPTCSDCHDPHTTLRADDARSSAHPLNIPTLCAACHEDAALMEPYGIPLDQVRNHRRSAHGKALFEDLNFAAPSCIGCHGSHAALPPDVSEIANVCGRCHMQTRRSFDEGPHGEANSQGTLPGCTACHSNHDTERIPAELEADTCLQCHDGDSEPAALGAELEEILVRAERAMESADEAIHELVRAGHDVSDARFRYRTALTQFEQLASAQHSVDLERLEDLERVVGSISRDIVGEAEVSAEERWEHKLFLLPVWFLTLATVVLAGSRLRRLRGATADSEPGRVAG
jgi:hypothetical protein